MKYQISTGNITGKSKVIEVEGLLETFFELWGVMEQMSHDAHLMLHVKMNDADERGFWQRRLSRLNHDMQVFMDACLFWEASGTFDHLAAAMANQPEASAFVTRLENDPLTWKYIPRDGSWGFDTVSVWPLIENEAV